MMTNKQILRLLTSVFTCTVEMVDIPYIRYRTSKKRVLLEDADYRLGNMFCSVGRAWLAEFNSTTAELAEWLKAHGALKIKPIRRKASFSIYD